MSDSAPDASPAPKPRSLTIKRDRETPAPSIKPSASSPVQNDDRQARGSSFLRKLLWLVLAGWLVCLAFMLLDPMPFLFPGDDDIGAWWHVDSTPVAAAPPVTGDTPAAPDHPALQALRAEVASAIVNRDIGNAMRLIQKQQQSSDLYPYPDELNELAGHLRALNRINTIVADTVREHIDETITIRVQGRAIDVIPRASAGDRVNVLVVPKQTNSPQRSSTFKVTDLTAAERARLLGDPDTPRKCLMKLYLHLEAEDRDAARAFASGCGTLADALVDQLGPATP